MSVEALVAKWAVPFAQVEVAALFLLKLDLVVAQQLVFLLFGVDPILGRANVVGSHATLGTSSAK